MPTVVCKRPNCDQCLNTFKAMDEHGLEYETVNPETDPGVAAWLRSLGHYQLPVVLTDEDFWSGFWPNKIDDLARRLREQPAAA